MRVRCIAILTQLFVGAAVRDSTQTFARGSQSIIGVADRDHLRISHSGNQSAGLCNAEEYENSLEFCVTIKALPVLSVINLDIGMKVNFERDQDNCFTFRVSAGVGVRIWRFAVSLNVDYEVAQETKTKHKKCSRMKPSPKMILGYLVGRVLQYAKEDTGSDLVNTGSEVMLQYEAKKSAWASGPDPERVSIKTVAESLSWIHGQVKAKYQTLRGSITPDCMQEAVNLALRAFKEAYTYAGGPSDVETCLELHASKTETDKWVWCYFTNLYPFTVDSYQALLDATCMAGDAHSATWQHVRDSSLGLVVEANPELCDEDVDEPCLVTFPRQFISLYPCTTFAIMVCLVHSDTNYDPGAAFELLLHYTDKEFEFVDPGMGGMDLRDESAVKEAATLLGKEVAKRVQAHAGEKPLKDYEKYMFTYAEQVKELVMPKASAGEGYANEVDTDAMRFELREQLSVGVVASVGQGFCDPYKSNLRLTHTIDLSTWRYINSCISNRVYLKLVDNELEEWALELAPSICGNLETGAFTTRFPVSLEHKLKTCAANLWAKIAGSPEKSICIGPEYHAVSSMREALLGVAEAGQIATSEIDGNPTASEMEAKFKAIGSALMSAIRVVATIIAQSALFNIASSALSVLFDGMEGLLPVVEIECAKLVKETIDVSKIPSKGAGALQTPAVGYETKVNVGIGGVEVQAFEVFEAEFEEERVEEGEEHKGDKDEGRLVQIGSSE